MVGVKEFAVPAVTGREEKARAWLLERYSDFGAKVDRAGNVVFSKKGIDSAATSRMVVVPMDEVGLYVISATEEGLLHIRTAGSVDSRVLVSKRVFVGYDKDGKAPRGGVIGAMAIHQQTAEDRKHVLPVTDLYVDIGAKDKAEALSYAPMGTPVWFDSPIEEFGSLESPVIAGRAADRALLWQVADRLCREEVAGDTTFVFASRSEVGGIGSKGAAYACDAQEALLLVSLSADDAAMEKEDRMSQNGCLMRKGAAVALRVERTPNARRGVKCMQFALEKGIPVQEYVLTADNEDFQEIETTKCGIPTLLLGLPTRYRHSPMPMAAICDAEAIYRLAHELLLKSSIC